MCSPKMAPTFGFSRQPSSIIIFAPPCSPMGGVSSAGWKMSVTVPGMRARIPASTSATPISIAVWASCPHACITPHAWPFHSVRTVLLNGTSTSSTTGRASMSARRATPGPGRPPFSTPTTPVWATFSRTTSKPSERRWSATIRAVRVSRLPSSGFWWKSRRQATTRGATRAAAASTAASNAKGLSGAFMARFYAGPIIGGPWTISSPSRPTNTSTTTRTPSSSTAAARWSTCSWATRSAP